MIIVASIAIVCVAALVIILFVIIKNKKNKTKNKKPIEKVLIGKKKTFVCKDGTVKQCAGGTYGCNKEMLCGKGTHGLKPTEKLDGQKETFVCKDGTVKQCAGDTYGCNKEMLCNKANDDGEDTIKNFMKELKQDLEYKLDLLQQQYDVINKNADALRGFVDKLNDQVGQNIEGIDSLNTKVYGPSGQFY